MERPVFNPVEPIMVLALPWWASRESMVQVVNFSRQGLLTSAFAFGRIVGFAAAVGYEYVLGFKLWEV